MFLTQVLGTLFAFETPVLGRLFLDITVLGNCFLVKPELERLFVSYTCTRKATLITYLLRKLFVKDTIMQKDV